jgi:beta-lactamase class A
VLLLRRALLGNSPTLPSAQQRRLLRLMRKVTPGQRWGAGYGLPPGWTAAVKNGWYHTVPGDEGPVNRSRVNTTGIIFDEQGKPRWIIAGFSNRWRSDRAGIRAWNAMSKHVARVLAD